MFLGEKKCFGVLIHPLFCAPCTVIFKIKKTFTVFLLSFSINLVFYHECHTPIPTWPPFKWFFLFTCKLGLVTCFKGKLALRF